MNDSSLMLIGLMIGLTIGMSASSVGTYTSMMTSLLGHKKAQWEVITLAMLVLFYIFMLVIIASLTLATIITFFSPSYLDAMYIAGPIIGIIVGLVYVRHYFWDHPIVRITHHKTAAHKHTTKYSGYLQPLVVAATLLYVTGLPIIVSMLLLTLLAQLSGGSMITWSISLAFGIIVPLYGVLSLVASKTKVSRVIAWKESVKTTMALYSGLAIILLSWFVLYAALIQGGNT